MSKPIQSFSEPSDFAAPEAAAEELAVADLAAIRGGQAEAQKTPGEELSDQFWKTLDSYGSLVPGYDQAKETAKLIYQFDRYMREPDASSAEPISPEQAAKFLREAEEREEREKAEKEEEMKKELDKPLPASSGGGSSHYSGSEGGGYQPPVYIPNDIGYAPDTYADVFISDGSGPGANY